MKPIMRVAIAVLLLAFLSQGPIGCTGKVKSDLEEAKKQLITMKNEKTELAAKLKDASTKVETLTKELEASKAEAAVAKAKVEELEAKLKSMESSSDDTE